MQIRVAANELRLVCRACGVCGIYGQRPRDGIRLVRRELRARNHVPNLEVLCKLDGCVEPGDRTDPVAILLLLCNTTVFRGCNLEEVGCPRATRASHQWSCQND